jgi:hypothetical protein
MSEKTMLLRLNDAARIETDKAKRSAFKTVALALATAVGAFAKAPTAENLRDVNGLWARAEAALKAATPVQPPSAPLAPTQRAPAQQERKAA